MPGAALTYWLKSTNPSPDPLIGWQKIIDYLLTFVGEVEVKKPSEKTALIYYTDTQTVAKLEADAPTGQISLTCDPSDNVTINLIKNVTKNISWRIFNTKTKSFLVNEPNLLEVSTNELELNISKVFKRYRL